MPAKVVSIEGDRACVTVPAPDAERAGLKAGAELTAFAPGGPVLVLTASDEFAFLAGSLAALSMAELFGLLRSSVRTGTLVVEDGRARRTVSFREGQVCQASSTDPGDRLGPILWRHRMLSLAVLRELEPLVKPGVRFGKLLTDRGHLTAAHLYKGMQLHVREIVLGIFGVAGGRFAFIEGAPDAAVVKLPESIRDLVLAGVQRADEVSALRRRVLRDTVFAATGAKPPSDPHVEALLALVDGRRTFGDLVEESRLGDYAALKALAALEGARAVFRVASQTHPTPVSVPARQAVGPGSSPSEVYAAVFGLIANALKSTGASVEVLNTFFDSLPRGTEALFRGVRFDDSGALDVARVLANTAAAHPDQAMGRARALETLDTLAMFALFELRNRLPADAGRQLAIEVEKLQRGIQR